VNKPVLVVGGDGVFVQNVLGPKLQEVGIEVGWIWDRNTNPQFQVPKGCGGILILKSAIGHIMAGRASAMARDAGVPWVRVEHRFSKALPLLRAVGMVEPESNGVNREPPSQEDQYEVVLSYVQQELDKGRTPPRGQISAVVKRAFGPHVNVRGSIIDKARGVAASRTTVQNPKQGESMSAAAVAPEPTFDWSQLSEWLVLIIEEHPEESREEWVTRLCELTVGDLPPQEELARLTENVYAEQWAIWETHHKTWPDDKRAAIMAMRRGWTKRFMLAHQEEHGELPFYDTVKEASRAVFPKAVHGGTIKEVKYEILGVDPPAASEPEPLPPEPEDNPPEELRRKGRYTTARINEAVKAAKAWHKRLAPPQAAALHDWVNRIMRNPRKARTPSDVKDLFVDFRRKPLEFAGAFLLIVPRGKTVSQGMIRAAYKKIMQVQMGPYVIELMAEDLNLTKRVTRVMDPPTSPEPVEGFFNSLNDAYNYFLGRAVDRVSRGAFRKLLADGQIEGQKESNAAYAPWLVSAASVDRYLSQHNTGETPEPTPPAADAPKDTAEVEALRGELEQMRRERDELRAARIAYASEFDPDEDGNPDVGSVHENIRKLKERAERHTNLRDQWKTKTEEARSEVDDLTQKLRLAEAKVRGAERERTAAQSEAEGLAQRLQASETKVLDAVEGAEQVKTLTTQVGTLRTEREAALQEAARLRTRLSDAALREAELETQLAELEPVTTTESDDGPSESMQPPGVGASSDLIQQVLAAGYRMVLEPAK
jgi:hypothetical protein